MGNISMGSYLIPASVGTRISRYVYRRGNVRSPQYNFVHRMSSNWSNRNPRHRLKLDRVQSTPMPPRSTLLFQPTRTSTWNRRYSFNNATAGRILAKTSELREIFHA